MVTGLATLRYRVLSGREVPRRSLIVLFTLLVGPSEILALLRQYAFTPNRMSAAGYQAYQSAVVITNFLLLSQSFSHPMNAFFAITEVTVETRLHPRSDVFPRRVTVTNFLLLVNFAVNFVLYCVVNVQFRHTCSALLTFFCRRCVPGVRQRAGREETAEAAAAGGACSSAVAMPSRPAAVVQTDAARACDATAH